MLRIAEQHDSEQKAWELYVAGNGKKNESWPDYAKRTGTLAATRPDATTRRASDERTIRDVKRRLGKLYKPPIQA